MSGVERSSAALGLNAGEKPRQHCMHCQNKLEWALACYLVLGQESLSKFTDDYGEDAKSEATLQCRHLAHAASMADYSGKASAIVSGMF